MNIILIGFMGAGKTTVAKKLADILHFEVCETDQEIVALADGKTIPQIFEEQGEEPFRLLETKALEQCLARSNTIVSTGGGIIESEKNRNLIRAQQATVVYLDTDFEVVCERLFGLEGRPVFQDKEQAKLRYDKRVPLYKELADITVSTNGLDEDGVAQVVSQFFLPTHTGSVQICCVLGDPIHHSLSPAVHNAAFHELGMSKSNLYSSLRCRAEVLGQVIAMFRAGMFLGASCTMPHKQEILPLLDEVDETAKTIGAVNTIVVQDGVLRGYNTDWIGIVEALKKKTDLKGKRIALLGAGGTARAALFGFQREEAVVTVYNRNLEKAQLLAGEFGSAAQPLDRIGDAGGADVIFNTTSVGMAPQDGQSLVPKECFQPGQIVMDAVYKPYYTKMLEDAIDQGAIVVPGCEMFLEQAVAQFELWTESTAPREKMECVIKESFRVV